MNEILKYQELDLEIQKLEGEILDNQDRKNALKFQQLLKDCQGKLGELNNRAKVLSANYAKYKEVFNQMAQNLELITKNLASEDEKKIDGLIEASDAITGNLMKLEKKLGEVVQESGNIQTEYTSIMKSARNYKSSMENYKNNYGEAKQEMEAQIAAKKAELEALSKKVDKQLLNKYKQKRTDKAKVFVAEINGRCGGCRMEISVSKLAVLKAEKMIECENCGRIIFIK